jgi:hypothetical protein
MALEFALRPRIDLERTAPRRRRVRLPRFALLMLAYWVGAAGATVALLRLMKEGPEVAVAAERPEEPGDNAAELDAVPEAEAQAAPAGEPAVASVAEPEPTSALTAEPSADVRLPEPAPRAEPPALEPPAPEAPARVQPGVPEHRLDALALRAVPARPTEAARARDESTRPEPATEREHLTVSLAARGEAAEPAAPRVREQAARAEPPPTSLPSCETAAASANETLDLRGAPGAPDLPREAFAAVLDNGAYLGACALPPRTALEICAAVQDGKVVGVSAQSEPRNPALNACVRRAVAALRFPKSARLDLARTRFEAAR